MNHRKQCLGSQSISEDVCVSRFSFLFYKVSHVLLKTFTIGCYVTIIEIHNAWGPLTRASSSANRLHIRFKSCWWPWMYNSLYRWRIETHSQCHSCQNKSNFRTSLPQLWDNVIFHFFFQSSPYGIEQRIFSSLGTYWNEPSSDINWYPYPTVSKLSQ